MDTKSITQPAPTTTRKETRADRARALYVDHAESIALSFNRGVYRVPSCTGAATYTVRLVPTPRCSCPDFRGGECKHISAVRVVRKAAAPCAGCGRRFFHRELVEAGGGNLTFFEGDMLCPECAVAHGVL